MAFDITLAPAEELELEPPVRMHRMSGNCAASIAIVLFVVLAAGRERFARAERPRASVSQGP